MKSQFYFLSFATAKRITLVIFLATCIAPGLWRGSVALAQNAAAIDQKIQAEIPKLNKIWKMVTPQERVKAFLAAAFREHEFAKCVTKVEPTQIQEGDHYDYGDWGIIININFQLRVFTDCHGIKKTFYFDYVTLMINYYAWSLTAPAQSNPDAATQEVHDLDEFFQHVNSSHFYYDLSTKWLESRVSFKKKEDAIPWQLNKGGFKSVAPLSEILPGYGPLAEVLTKILKLYKSKTEPDPNAGKPYGSYD